MTGVSLSLVMKRQPSTVLLAGGWDGLVIAKRPRLRDRVAAHIRRRRLDRALAGGIPPETSVALALRAERLTEPEHRRSMAQALRRILRESRDGGRAGPGRVPPSRARVRAAREQLAMLADTLEDPGPVSAGGAAQALMLLTDGTGPLYNPYHRTTLGAGAARAVRELRPWAA